MTFVVSAKQKVTAFLATFLLLFLFPVVMFAGTAELKNPLAVTDITDLLAAILTVVMVILTPVVVVYMIYAGYLFVMAQGRPEELQRARRALLYGMIGVVIIMGAFAIGAMIRNLVAAF